MQAMKSYTVSEYDKSHRSQAYAETFPCGMAKEKVYYKSGADEVRCVGGTSTCAGAVEVVLRCAAAFLFLHVLYHMCMHISTWKNHQYSAGNFVIYVHTHILTD